MTIEAVPATDDRPGRTSGPICGKDAFMWYVGGGILYLVLLVTLGIVCIRNGHWVLFILGIFLPFMWLIGAIMRPAARR